MEETVGVTIRPAEASDASAIHRVFASAIRGIDPQFYSEEQKQAWEEAVAPDSWTTRMLELSFWVAVQNGEVVGFVSWYEPEIVHVYTSGARRGTGTQLMETALTAMRSSETTLTASLNAVAFYEKFGFVEQEKLVKERGGIPIPCIRMRRVSV